ncbi:MAG TPA: polyprenyl diphosphate synthase [Candidatus Nanoarchaeia archaeon]|nr:polyprenyl diphosphate synthase [Candidatus Nanoarchaeia archaeon]
MVSKVPKHIAIILDGNRRYAKKLGIQMWKGHKIGMQKIKDLVDWCVEIGVEELTLYCFSTENFNRSKKEIDYLFGIFRNELKKMHNPEKQFKGKIRIKVIGRIEMFPKDMANLMKDVMKKTEKNDKFVLNLALAYGGRQEIEDSVKKICKKVKNGKMKLSEVNESTIRENLYLSSEPDLIIRPGMEVRISNFLIWQGAYSEWIFLRDRLWPEFSRKDFDYCMAEFNRRERRFGN